MYNRGRTVIHSFMIAFSMYSKIPMPQIEWTKENMKYSMCFFPLIGSVIGAISYFAYYICSDLQIGVILRTAILTILPLVLTGGIHLDGYLDTIDAKSSYQTKEEKLAILKDPHVGAFAVIYGIIYYILTFGLINELTEETLVFLCCGYTYSRALSGYGVIGLVGAKRDGLAVTFHEASHKKIVKLSMLCYVILVGAFMINRNAFLGCGVMLCGVAAFFSYKRMAYKEFGGITGDLAGYFLLNCELLILLSIIILGKLIG